ncbi:helix-turn-helix domain-containing protein [Micromonospora echinaurantiaca]|uniref:helix-turn-helix domain-containing protein n=1 Tax=Micromonospora echinaurantiaca TaxID=47857 RepID=UPI0037926A58
MTRSASRLTPAQREEIVALAASGEGIEQIGQCFGITRQAVRGLLRRRGCRQGGSVS